MDLAEYTRLEGEYYHKLIDAMRKGDSELVARLKDEIKTKLPYSYEGVYYHADRASKMDDFEKEAIGQFDAMTLEAQDWLVKHPDKVDEFIASLEIPEGVKKAMKKIYNEKLDDLEQYRTHTGIYSNAGNSDKKVTVIKPDETDVSEFAKLINKKPGDEEQE